MQKKPPPKFKQQNKKKSPIEDEYSKAATGQDLLCIQNTKTGEKNNTFWTQLNPSQLLKWTVKIPLKVLVLPCVADYLNTIDVINGAVNFWGFVFSFLLGLNRKP